jgi:general stress protein 26
VQRLWIIDMNKKDSIDRVWDIIEKVGVCMLTTQFVGGLRARPLEARPDRNGGSIFFVTDIHSSKEDEIETASDVGLVFIDPSSKAYLSITGRACIMRDVEKTKAVWRKTDNVTLIKRIALLDHICDQPGFRAGLFVAGLLH